MLAITQNTEAATGGDPPSLELQLLEAATGGDPPSGQEADTAKKDPPDCNAADPPSAATLAGHQPTTEGATSQQTAAPPTAQQQNVLALVPAPGGTLATAQQLAQQQTVVGLLPAPGRTGTATQLMAAPSTTQQLAVVPAPGGNGATTKHTAAPSKARQQAAVATVPAPGRTSQPAAVTTPARVSLIGSPVEGPKGGDRVEKKLAGSVGKRLKTLGFTPKHPVALFNSLSGCVVEVIESERMPHWVASKPGTGGALWVDVPKVTAATLGNITGAGHSNTKAARAKKWREELLKMMDADQDGQLEAEELLAFLASTATLRNDKLIQKVREEAEGKSTLQLLNELGPCMPIIMAELIHAKDKEEMNKSQQFNTATRGFISQSNNWEGSTEFAKHMQLREGYKDPEGIKVRARPGIAAMECLVANDPGGLMASLGAALMLPVTTALREVGYEDGKTMRGYCYDWRVPCTKLEERDQYMSRTMDDIADLVAVNNGEKAVVITHSLGGVMASYFFHWVAHSDYGKERGGSQWLKKHIHAFLPIGGPLLGTPYGSHSYITGDEGQGLAPMVFSYSDRHLVVRSWGMFGMIFPTGRQLMLQPTHSVHWVRREGLLNVHLLSVQVEGFNLKTGSNRYFYVKVWLQTASGRTKQLKCPPILMSSTGALDNFLQFYWAKEPDSIDDSLLSIELWRDWIGPIDKKLAKGTFQLSTKDIKVANGPDQGQKFPGLPPNQWVNYKFSLKENTNSGMKVAINVKLQFVPFNDKEMLNDFRRPASQDPGAFRCGGLADACSSKEKRDRLLKALGGVEGQEWLPEAEEDQRNMQHQEATYAPMSIDQMMVLDEMEGNYHRWKECYNDDPIWRKYSTEPPEGVKRIRPIYGINVPTLVGNVYRRETKRLAHFQSSTSLKLDRHCQVKHPGYTFNNGIVEETPHKTPQADDPTVPLSNMTFSTKASGDGTVAYWSLRWPITWKNRGIDVETIEVEGAGHRDILETKACLETCLVEACQGPHYYVEIWLDTVTAGSISWGCFCDIIGIGNKIFVHLDWHNERFNTEAIIAGSERGFLEKQRFVLGVTHKDLVEDNTIALSIRGISGRLVKDTYKVAVKISEMFGDGKDPRPVKMGNMSELKWHWHWYSSCALGQPNFQDEIELQKGALASR